MSRSAWNPLLFDSAAIAWRLRSCQKSHFSPALPGIRIFPSANRYEAILENTRWVVFFPVADAYRRSGTR